MNEPYLYLTYKTSANFVCLLVAAGEAEAAAEAARDEEPVAQDVEPEPPQPEETQPEEGKRIARVSVIIYFQFASVTYEHVDIVATCCKRIAHFRFLLF